MIVSRGTRVFYPIKLAKLFRFRLFTRIGGIFRGFRVFNSDGRNGFGFFDANICGKTTGNTRFSHVFGNDLYYLGLFQAGFGIY